MTNKRLNFNPDIAALVMENLEGDPRSLLSCALTHRTWHPHAIKVLYAAIHIRSHRACNALLSARKQRIDENTAYTKVLEIHEDDAGCFARRAILRLSGLTFLILNRLVFTGIDFGEDHRHPFWQVFGTLHRFVSVTTLELARCTFHTFRHFLRFISALPQLRRLKLVRLRVLQCQPIVADASVSVTSRGPKLEGLELEVGGKSTVGDFEDGLFTWLTSKEGAHTANLHVLRIQPTTPSERSNRNAATFCDSITDVLKVLGPSVTELAIPCLPQVRVNLSGHTQLQNLTLFLQGNYYDNWGGVCEQAELTFLTLNAIRLRRLTLVLAVTVSSIKPWASSGLSPLWMCLNKMISAGHFTRLGAAHIDFQWYAPQVFSSSDVAILQQRMEGDLKRLMWHAQKILTTTYTESFFPVKRGEQSAEGITGSILQICAWVNRIGGA